MVISKHFRSIERHAQRDTACSACNSRHRWEFSFSARVYHLRRRVDNRWCLLFLLRRRSVILFLLLVFHRRSIVMKPIFQPLSLFDVFAFQVLLFFPLCLRPFHGRALVFFPLLCAIYHRLVTSSLGDAPLDWSLALALTPQLIKALDVWVLTDAERELRRVDALHEDPVKFDIWKKIAWAVELVSTPRGVGWNWEVPYVCYAGTTSRR